MRDQKQKHTHGFSEIRTAGVRAPCIVEGVWASLIHSELLLAARTC